MAAVVPRIALSAIHTKVSANVVPSTELSPFDRRSEPVVPPTSTTNPPGGTPYLPFLPKALSLPLWERTRQHQVIAIAVIPEPIEFILLATTPIKQQHLLVARDALSATEEDAVFVTPIVLPFLLLVVPHYRHARVVLPLADVAISKELSTEFLAIDPLRGRVETAILGES